MEIKRIVVPGRISRSGDCLRAFAADLANRLGAETLVLWGARERDLKTFDYAVGDLLAAPAIVRRDVTTVVPFDESGLLARRLDHRAIIPLSNDEAGLFVTRESLPIVAKLGFSVLFWHSTWRNRENPSTKPADHMDAEAAIMIGRAERAARDAGIKFETLVETADTIEYGAVQAALDHRCPLIIMARGRKTVRGSYVQRVLERSPVPVLVLGRQGGRP